MRYLIFILTLSFVFALQAQDYVSPYRGQGQPPNWPKSVEANPFSAYFTVSTYSIQEPPTGWHLLTGEPTKGPRHIGQALSLGGHYQKEILWLYGRLAYAKVNEQETRRVEKDYYYAHLTAGIGARTKYLALGAGLSYVIDYAGQNSQGINMAGMFTIPVNDLIKCNIVADYTVTTSTRQISTLGIGLEYALK